MAASQREVCLFVALCTNALSLFVEKTLVKQKDELSIKHTTVSLNYVWVVTCNYEVFKCKRPCYNSDWRLMNGKLKQIDADDYEVWGVNESDSVFKATVDGGGKWEYVPGKFVHVSASGSGFIWGINSDEEIFKCKKPCNGTWIRVDGLLKQLDAGYDNVYGIDCKGDIFYRPVDGSGKWKRIMGKLKYITGGGHEELFGVNKNDEVFRCTKPCYGEWTKVEGQLRQCDATINVLLGVNANGEIFQLNL